MSTEQIQYLLDLLSYETVTEFDGYRVMRQGMGYNSDPKIGAIQAHLSILLQMKSDNEGN